MRRFVYLVSATIFLGFTTPSDAAYVIDVQQVGSTVVFTGAGSINISALSFNGSGIVSPFVAAFVPSLDLGSKGAVTRYSASAVGGIVGPSNLGPGGVFLADSGTGAPVGFGGGQNGGILVPLGYMSGEALGISTAAYNGSLASLGLQVGSYQFTWSAGGLATDSITVNIGSAVAAPEPGTWIMMIAGIGGVGGILRRKHRKMRTIILYE